MRRRVKLWWFRNYSQTGVVTETVMDAYRATPRENFVPRDRGSACYIDETVDLGNGKYLLEPMIHGLLVENAEITASDKILVVGAYHRIFSVFALPFMWSGNRCTDIK